MDFQRNYIGESMEDAALEPQGTMVSQARPSAMALAETLAAARPTGVETLPDIALVLVALITQLLEMARREEGQLLGDMLICDEHVAIDVILENEIHLAKSN